MVAEDKKCIRCEVTKGAREFYIFLNRSSELCALCAETTTLTLLIDFINHHYLKQGITNGFVKSYKTDNTKSV